MPTPTLAVSAADRQRLLEKLAAAADRAGHVWPQYAACEAAVETGWLSSSSASQANNLFGCKQHSHPIFGTVSLPTREFLGGQWIELRADFVSYPSWDASFLDRMETLRRLAPEYPHYAAALSATDGETYVRQVSQSWSTDPFRADTVLTIHRAHFAAQPAADETV